MLHLARSMGFVVRPEPGDATVRRISRPLFASGSRQH
jgi:hypothetical protein